LTQSLIKVLSVDSVYDKSVRGDSVPRRLIFFLDSQFDSIQFPLFIVNRVDYRRNR
jgi:hypothetical protein